MILIIKKKIEIDEEMKNFYDAVEPRTAGEEDGQYVFDDAQREEDKEIAHVVRSHPSKRKNSVPVPFHHMDFIGRTSKKRKIAGHKKNQN